MKNLIMHALGFALAALAYIIFMSLLMGVQFAIDTYWLWLSFITCGFVLFGFIKFIRGGDTFDDRITMRLAKKGFLKQNLSTRAFMLIVVLFDGLVLIIFWPVFLLSTASFSFTGRGLIADSRASAFRMRSRQFFISSLVLMGCMAWQLVANSSSLSGSPGLNKFYANMFLLGTAVWLLLSILRPIDVESRAYGSTLGARFRVFFGCIFSFGAFVSAMALAGLLVRGQLPNIQEVAVRVIFGGLFSSETDAIASGLRRSFDDGSTAPILSVLNEVGFIQITLILFNLIFFAAILKKTLSPIIQKKNFVRTDIENTSGAIAMINAGDLTDAEIYTRDLPEWRVAPTLLNLCKLVERLDFDELLRRSPDLVVAHSVERGKNLDVSGLNEREKWVLLFLNLNTFLDIKAYFNFANWSITQEYLSDIDLTQLVGTFQARFGDENRTSMLLIYFNRDDSPGRVKKLTSRLLSPSFSELSLSEEAALSASEFSNVLVSIEAQKGLAACFLRSALFNRYTDEETDSLVMRNFTNMQMLRKLRSIHSLIGFEGADLLYLFSFLNVNRGALDDDTYKHLVSLINQSDSSGFFNDHFANNLNMDVVDAVMEEQLAKLIV